jgi:hypothetical protein
LLPTFVLTVETKAVTGVASTRNVEIVASTAPAAWWLFWNALGEYVPEYPQLKGITILDTVMKQEQTGGSVPARVLAAQTACIRLKVGDPVLGVKDPRKGTIIGIELTPNSLDDPGIVALLAVDFGTVRVVGTSQHFRPVPDQEYDRHYPSHMLNGGKT